VAGRCLRGRLLGQLIALVAAACLVMGVVTEAGLQTYLITKLDGQLNNAVGAVDRPDGLPTGIPPPDAQSGNDGRRPFGGVPSVTVNVENGVVKYAYTLTQQGPRREVDSD